MSREQTDDAVVESDGDDVVSDDGTGNGGDEQMWLDENEEEPVDDLLDMLIIRETGLNDDSERLRARLNAMERCASQLAEDDETAVEYRQTMARVCKADGQSLARGARRRAAPVSPARARAARLFDENEWIWQNRDAARTVTDEDLSIQQHMLSLVVGAAAQAAVAAPPRGTNRICAMATSVETMRLQSWMLTQAPPLFTTNIVATADLGTTINALTLVNRIAGASFNPRCFAAVKLRMHGSTHLIFSSGLMVCTGSKSTDNARVACIDTAQLLLRAGIHAQFLNFKVRNVASTSNAGFEVDLAAIANAYPLNSHYVADGFPGLMFRLAQSRVVLTVFKTGCCNLTGVPTRREAIVAWTWFYCNVLWHFQARSGDAAERSRRACHDASIVEQVCESMRDVTHSLFTSTLAEPQQPTTTNSPPPLDLEQWLRAARAK